MSLFSVLRNNFWKTSLLGVITIQVLNMSFEAVDLKGPGDSLAIREIESCVEFIYEIAFDKDSGIPDTEDHDHPGRKPGNTITFFTFFTASEEVALVEFKLDYSCRFRQHAQLKSGYLTKLYTPPKTEMI